MSIDKKNNRILLTLSGGGSSRSHSPPSLAKYAFPSAMGFKDPNPFSSDVGIGFPAAREVASAKNSSTRKNNTIDNVVMFERIEMIKGEEMRKDIENV